MTSHLGMEIPWEPLVPAVAPLVQLGLHCCPASVNLVWLSRVVWAHVLGNALHRTLVTKAIALAAQVPEPIPAGSLESRLKGDVWDLLAAQRALPTWVDGDPLIVAPPLQDIANYRGPGIVTG